MLASSRGTRVTLLSVAMGTFAVGQAEAVTEYNRYPASNCRPQEPTLSGLYYESKGSLVNNSGSGRVVVCPLHMPNLFFSGDSISVNFFGTPDAGSENGVTCNLYATSKGTILASTSATTNSSGQGFVSLTNSGWGSNDAAANLRCFVQGDEELYNVHETLNY